MLLADRGYDAANIPPKRNRTKPLCFSPYLYRARNLVERFFNKIKQCRRVATRYTVTPRRGSIMHFDLFTPTIFP